jgi:tetratricopeptide (TPR) repeat protein
MMGPGDDLDSLSKSNDHLGVLRYIRAHELRESEKVIKHGQALLGEQVKNSKSGLRDEAARSAALEQICLAAIDIDNHLLAERCLDELKQTSTGGVGGSGGKNKDGSLVKDSDRYRRLLGRCLEAANDYEGALILYEKMLKENPSNLIALQRKYCILRQQKSETGVTPMNVVLDALNEYLGQQLSDVCGWYEMSQLRLSLADFKGAAYALEQVILGSPLDADIHRELGEVYATIGGLEYSIYARKHMAQALELDPTNIRAQFGLICVANQYLDESNSSSKKNIDEHERLVAKELVKYGADSVLKSYKGSKDPKMIASVKRVIDDYTENLE